MDNALTVFISDDRRKAICCVSLRCDKVEVVRAVGAFAKNAPGVSLACTFSGTQINPQPAIHGQIEAAEGA
eukprot:4433850-Pleurochrysis_carterae.AAC.1